MQSWENHYYFIIIATKLILIFYVNSGSEYYQTQEGVIVGVYDRNGSDLRIRKRNLRKFLLTTSIHTTMLNIVFIVKVVAEQLISRADL